MSNNFKHMIYLFSCGARGRKPVLEHKIDITKIYSLAKSQGVWPTTFLSIKQMYDENQIILDKQIFSRWRLDIMAQVMQNTKRNIFVHNTIGKLEQNNIPCYVLKGETIAELYNNPNSRISGDTDILINKRHEKKAAEILQQIGFEVKPRTPTSHHLCAYHPIGGLIELHHRLYDKLFEDVWFDNKLPKMEKNRKIKTDQGNYIKSLSINDGLIFITFHFIKHFLYKGAGIRQLMDALLYMSSYKNEIDWEQFDKIINYLKYEKFVNNVIGIGIEYLGFDKNDLPMKEYDYDIMQKILLDMEEGGGFGREVIERKYFYEIYSQERFKRFKHGDYQRYMNRWKRTSNIKMLFPNRNVMSIKYSYVENNKLLLLVAWIHRFLNMLKKGKFEEYHNSGDINDIVKKRMDFIRELDMI